MNSVTELSIPSYDERIFGSPELFPRKGRRKSIHTAMCSSPDVRTRWNRDIGLYNLHELIDHFPASQTTCPDTFISDMRGYRRALEKKNAGRPLVSVSTTAPNLGIEEPIDAALDTYLAFQSKVNTQEATTSQSHLPQSYHQSMFPDTGYNTENPSTAQSSPAVANPEYYNA